MEQALPVFDPSFSPKKALFGVNIDDALNIVGFGSYQVVVSIIAGIAFLAAGIQNGITAFILPSMKCDLSLTNSQMGLLNAAFLVGGISSGLVWGAIVDPLGRKPVLFYGLLADSIVTTVSTLSQDFYVFLGFRLLNGFIIGGPASVVIVYAGELLPQRYRAQTLCYIGLTWALSWVVTAGLAWMIIPIQLQWEPVEGILFTSWRLLLVVVGFIEFCAGLLYLKVHESPKVYLSRGRCDLALNVLAEMFAQNHGQCPLDYPVKSLEEKVNEVQYNTGVDCVSKSVWRPMLYMLRLFKSILQGPALLTTALASSLWFTNMFGYYGLGLWMPELANSFQTFEGSNFTLEGISVCELTKLHAAGETGCTSTIDPSVFTNTLISGGSLVVGNVAAAFLASRLPRRLMPVSFMFGAAACVMLFFFVRSSMEYLIVSSLFQLCIGTANLVHNVLVVDIFPPEVSGLAICLSIMCGRVGAMIANIVIGQLLHVSCEIPIILCAVVIAAGGVASGFIPRPYEHTTKKPLPVISRNFA